MKLNRIIVLFVFFFDSPPRPPAPPIQSCYVVVVAADAPNLLALNALACSRRELGHSVSHAKKLEKNGKSSNTKKIETES